MGRGKKKKKAEQVTCHGAPRTHCSEQQASHGQHDAHIVVATSLGAAPSKRTQTSGCGGTACDGAHGRSSSGGNGAGGGVPVDAAPASLSSLPACGDSQAPGCDSTARLRRHDAGVGVTRSSQLCDHTNTYKHMHSHTQAHARARATPDALARGSG